MKLKPKNVANKPIDIRFVVDGHLRNERSYRIAHVLADYLGSFFESLIQGPVYIKCFEEDIYVQVWYPNVPHIVNGYLGVSLEVVAKNGTDALVQRLLSNAHRFFVGVKPQVHIVYMFAGRHT